MNGRNVEQDLGEFFRRLDTPEPSERLRAAVAAARLQAPASRMGRTTRRTALSLVGLAATVVLAAGLVLGIGLRGQPSATGAPGTFVATGSLTTDREMSVTSTLLADGRVLIIGGDHGQLANGQQPPTTAEIYDPRTGTFSRTGSPIGTRWDYTATLLPDGRVLVAGGSTEKNGLADSSPSAELYDPTTGQFAATGPMVADRSDHTATLLPDGRVLIAGGTSADGIAAVAELYDPKTGTFSPTGSMTFPPGYGETATLLADGRVLIAGGLGFGDPASAQVYDPATGTFSPAGSMTTGRSSHTATLLQDGLVLISGGTSNNGMAAFDSAELYNPKTGKFSSTGWLIGPRGNAFATLLRDGRVLIVGGDDPTTPEVSLASAELYDPSTGAFNLTGSIPNPPGYALTATLLSDGRVLVTGGRLAFLYTP
jgi:hypothetical protein